MNIHDLKKLLTVTIPQKLAVLITSSPGIGKSDTVQQVTEELQADLMICHPVVDDPVDYKGLPFAKNGKAEFLPFGNLHKLITAEKLTVCLFDDLGQSAPMVQAAIMQLILAREINGKKISEHVCFIACTNRKQDKAGVAGILEPLKSRFATIINLEVSPEIWCEWAIKNNLPAELIAFIRFRPDILDGFKASSDMVNSSCPRTIAHVGKLFPLIPENLQHEVFSGSAGEVFASEFCGFLRIFKSIPNINEIFKNPSSVSVPNESNILFALTGILAQKVDKGNINNLFIYLEKLPIEFQVLLVNDIKIRNQEILNCSSFIAWAQKNQNVFV